MSERDTRATDWRGISFGSVGLALAAAAVLVHLSARCAAPRSSPDATSAKSETRSAVAPEREPVLAPPAPTAGAAAFSLASQPVVRVSLTAVRGATRVRLSSDGPCEVAVGDAPSVKRTALANYDVVATRDGLEAAGLRKGALVIRFRAEGGLSIDGRKYRGELTLSLSRSNGAGIEAVNSLPMEDYLRGVVAGEMPRHFPSAALDAQAIVARTYAIATVAGLREGATLVLADDVSDQVYGGRGLETKETDAAVRRTSGQVVLFDGSPIVAYFHSTCGGHTSDPGPVLSRPTSPPLRGVPCGYCADSPHARWAVDVTREDVRRALVACGLDAGAVAAFSLTPGARDEGGRLLEVRLASGRDGALSGVDANAFRIGVGSRIVKSTRIESIDAKGASLRFEGSGFGHGCGLCQYGARGLAAAGRDARAILEHYFPGAAVARAYPLERDGATSRR